LKNNISKKIRTKNNIKIEIKIFFNLNNPHYNAKLYYNKNNLKFTTRHPELGSGSYIKI